MRGYIFLFVAILFEIAGAALLKLSDGFTNIIPTLFLILFYGLSFTALIFALKTISLSIGYSIWAGLGTAGTALVGVFLFNEVLTGINILGLIVIISGVVIMNVKETAKNKDEAHST